MGPLAGIKILELGGIGPGPFCVMLLADLGADALRIDRVGSAGNEPARGPQFNLLHRGRRSVGMDLKKPGAVQAVLKLVREADVLVEGFRPGVTERLGLGPAECLKENPRLIYGRMTGWGQDGPLAQKPGHDINYIALSGVLHSIGYKDGPPVPPLNLVGDFGGGSLYLALGILAALVERSDSGRGQVIDASMVDGSASLMTFFYGLRAAGLVNDKRGTNRLDTGAPFYNVYETSDGLHIALGSNEPHFYSQTLTMLGLADEGLPAQTDRQGWERVRERFAAVIKTRTRDDWVAVAEGYEVCLSPVLSMAEAPAHPHNRARGTFVDVNGVVQPAPAPRFSRTEATIGRSPPAPGENPNEALSAWGFSEDELRALQGSGAIIQTGKHG